MCTHSRRSRQFSLVFFFASVARQFTFTELVHRFFLLTSACPLGYTVIYGIFLYINIVGLLPHAFKINYLAECRARSNDDIHVHQSHATIRPKKREFSLNCLVLRKKPKPLIAKIISLNRERERKKT